MIPLILAGTTVGAAAGYTYNFTLGRRRSRAQAAAAEQRLRDAKEQAREVVAEAKAQAKSLVESGQRDERERRQQLGAVEAQLLRRQENLDKKHDDLDRRQEQVRAAELELDRLKEELRALKSKQQVSLEQTAALSRADARDKLMATTERELRADLVKLVEKLQNDAMAEADDRARMIIVTAMERVASEQTAERTITTVPLTGDDMKGRIIGKEGRNIQALERATGVDVIIDETPGAIVLSSFDPIRRQVARVALEKLLSDGRIHPARIEEVVAKVTAELDKEIKQTGEAALKETGVVGVPAELVVLLGQLKFRTSYSQNVLKHSVEMAHLAGIIAREIGANVRIAKTAALLHDIGKAVTHEVEGGHHHIGAQLAEQYGMEPAICHAIKAHHDDVEATTPEALVVRVVDALSASRPGARGDTLEHYAKRMTELENLANAFPAVSKSYAISAGRELRIIVTPEKLDDYGAIKLARSIAKKIESNLRYPGTVKVNVIRETRAVEFAK